MYVYTIIKLQIIAEEEVSFTMADLKQYYTLQPLRESWTKMQCTSTFNGLIFVHTKTNLTSPCYIKCLEDMTAQVYDICNVYLKFYLKKFLFK